MVVNLAFVPKSRINHTGLGVVLLAVSGSQVNTDQAAGELWRI